MSLRCGIVGLPNVGKSTLFNALTRAHVPADNYPFCTIEPNIGVVPVPDPRLEAIARITKPPKTVPATVEFVDIAGLVAGASRGEGLGNRFLAAIREVDAIAHVVRCFEHADIAHLTGSVDPERDIGIVNMELALADLESVDKALARAEKASKAGDKDTSHWRDALLPMREHLNAGRPIRSLELDDYARGKLSELPLLTARPVMYVANVLEDGFAGNLHLDAVRRIAAEEGAEVVPVCAALEAEIGELDPADRAEFLADLGVAEPGLGRVVHAGYRLLGLHTFFTTGDKEVRAWTLRRGGTALEAAGLIHTDFEQGFIRAETIAYDDFIACHGEHGAREAGRMRLEGRDYVVQEGDVLYFRFNV